MTEPIQTDLPRETGSEKSGAECPTCGAELPVVATPYGSQVKGACPNCTTGDQLEAQTAAANEEKTEGQEPEVVEQQAVYDEG